MTKIGLFFGSTAGSTATAAELIAKEIEHTTGEVVDIFDICDTDIETFYEYDYLIIGVPTYNIGELQDDWYIIYDNLASLTLTGLDVALFGLGDQYNYSETFQDALGILGHQLRDTCGATLHGYWPTAGYDFIESQGVENGNFMGLALDDDNQPELTEQRIKMWVGQLIGEFGIARHPQGSQV